MFKVKIYVTLKEGVLDPQGDAVTHSLHRLSFPDVENVRIGKYIEMTMNEGNEDVDTQICRMCDRLLANPVIENYRYEVEEVAPQ